MKKCTGCSIHKPIDQFYARKNLKTGLATACISCYKNRFKQYHIKNAAKECERARQYRKENKLAIRKQKNEYEKSKMSTDPVYAMKKRLRRRLLNALDKGFKAGSAVRDMGCTGEELKVHIESLFQPGMNWENRHLWHIDHIMPLAMFDLTQRKELLIACHYTNLRPLWAVDNIQKGARYEPKAS